MFLIFNSCGIFKTHHKDKLIDFKNNSIPEKTLKLNGYYYTELEYEYRENAPSFIGDYIKKTGINKIKYLSVFFIYEDGFAINLNGIDGLSHYYCAQKEKYDNTYESAHKTIELMLESQYSTDNRTKRRCGFKPNSIGRKSLVKIINDSIKIQTYRIEHQTIPGGGNSAYLYELKGTINSDKVFIITSETEYRNNITMKENSTFEFRETEQKPNIKNYFKKNKNRFK